MAFKDYRQQSRDVRWGTSDDRMTLEQINAGSLLRIADALELSAKDREKLERDYKYVRSARDEYRRRCESLERRIAAMKGVITKLKKRANT